MSDLPDGQRLLSSLALAALVLDPELRIRHVNPAGEQMLGISARRLNGRRFDELISFSEARLADWVGQGDAQVSARAVDVVIDNSAALRVDLTLAPVNDFPGWQVMTLYLIGGAEELEETNERSVRTPAILAHEIKNPLAAIRGASQLLARSVADKEKGLTKLIAEEVDRIAKLIDRMQSLGREQPEPVAECNLHEVIHRARAVVEAAGDANVVLVEEFDPSLPLVLGNADGLVQVLINLIANARDACRGVKEPRIVLRTRFVSGFVMNAIRLGRPIRLPIEVRVSDNGPGIDPAVKDHIFEPFVSSKKNGQGLGLALVKKLVRDMDGRISVEREDSTGQTHFSVHLPMAKSQGGIRAA